MKCVLRARSYPNKPPYSVMEPNCLHAPRYKFPIKSFSLTSEAATSVVQGVRFHSCLASETRKMQD